MHNHKRLIIVEGIPGSGKTSTATAISERFKKQRISTRCYLELEENHPLLAHEVNFDHFNMAEDADRFIELITSRYRNFVQERLNSPEQVTIIESVMLQDTINVSHLMGMSEAKLREFCMILQKIIEPLCPALVYYYHLDVEAQWRFICSVRGNEWGPVSLHTDEDFQQAGEVWSKSQAFVRAVVDEWNIPKLIIENRDYLWDEYSHRINEFLDHVIAQDSLL